MYERPGHLRVILSHGSTAQAHPRRTQPRARRGRTHARSPGELYGRPRLWDRPRHRLRLGLAQAPEGRTRPRQPGLTRFSVSPTVETWPRTPCWTPLPETTPAPA